MLHLGCPSFDVTVADRLFSGWTSCKCNADRKSLWRVPMAYALLISVFSHYFTQYYDWLLTSSDEVHFFCDSPAPPR
jgi:hypothetical protein